MTVVDTKTLPFLLRYFLQLFLFCYSIIGAPRYPGIPDDYCIFVCAQPR